MNRHRVPLGILVITGVLTLGCGKRGNPLPPLQRIPAPPGDFSVTRIDSDVYARFTAPTVNADGVGPADVARVELYAITAERAPALDDPGALRRLATLVGTEQVRRPLPPPPPPKEGIPPIPLPPPGPGVDQGAAIVLREALTPETQVPPQVLTPSSRRSELALAAPGPLVASGEGPQRFYFVVGVSPRGRYGPPTPLLPVPLGPTSSAPPTPEVKVSEKTMAIHWRAPGDARGVPEPTPPDVLPSRPVAPSPPPTTYDVYEVPRAPAPANATPVMPKPLTPAPVGALEFVQEDVTLGTERCFVVRPVDILAGIHVRGPASPVVCASFADTFAPAPPGDLVAVSASGSISLIWNPSAAPDLAGYLVLRGEGPGGTLSPLMPAPVAATTYTDTNVRPGTLYIYAVIAVDKAGNRSAESNRVEETGRE